MLNYVFGYINWKGGLVIIMCAGRSVGTSVELGERRLAAPFISFMQVVLLEYEYAGPA